MPQAQRPFGFTVGAVLQQRSKFPLCQFRRPQAAVSPRSLPPPFDARQAIAIVVVLHAGARDLVAWLDSVHTVRRGQLRVSIARARLGRSHIT